MLYVNFAMLQYPVNEAQRLMYAPFRTLIRLIQPTDIDIRPTISYQRLNSERPLSDQELYDRIRRTVLNKQDVQVLESFLIFNKYVFLAACHTLRNRNDPGMF